MDKHGFNNPHQLSKSLGYPNAENVGRVFRDDKNSPSFKLLSDLTRVFKNLNFNWLLSGNGEMMLADMSDKTENTNTNKPVIVNEPKTAYLAPVTDSKAIPLVNARAVAGFYNATFNITEDDIQAHYVVPDFERIDFMLRVIGNSMYPRYTSGDVVACRIIKNIQFIQWNKPYLIAAGEQGLIIKRILPTNDAKIVELQSDNPAYPPILVNIADIQGLALIVGTIRLE